MRPIGLTAWNDSGTANSGTDESYREADAAQQDADGGRPARQGLARYARPALIAGAVIAVVCAALLVIIFFLDSFNATVYSVGGKDVTDATDEAKAIRESYAGARIGGIIFLVRASSWPRPAAWCCTGTGTSPVPTTRTTARTWTSRTSAGGSPATLRTAVDMSTAPRRILVSDAWSSLGLRTRWTCPCSAPAGAQCPSVHWPQRRVGMSPCCARTRWTCPSPGAPREHARAPAFTGNEFLALALTEC